MNLLNKITLSISFIGIILLLILANLISPKITEIKDINIKNLNKKVKIYGTLNEIKNYDNLQILTISQNQFYINVLVYKKIDIPRGKKLLINGKIIKYKNDLEIQADSIYSISHFPE
ncbi:MAG: hypothetical protein AABW83_02100 [Nanoarchaeota archaeon]